MKVCLSSRQSATYLSKANEIKVRFRDRKIIPDLADEYPDATIILQQGMDDVLDKNECEKYRVLTRDKFIVCLSDLGYADLCKEMKIPFYWGFPVQTYYQLSALKDLGVCYVRLDAPLFFDLDNVKDMGVPIRAVPNVAYNDGLKRSNGVNGLWIRPEDLEIYENYIDAIEFERCNQIQEQGLYRIYFEQREWKTELGVLIADLDYKGNNRFIAPGSTKPRINCRQRCAAGGACRICYRILDLADQKLLQQYKDNLANK